MNIDLTSEEKVTKALEISDLVVNVSDDVVEAKHLGITEETLLDKLRKRKTGKD